MGSKNIQQPIQDFVQLNTETLKNFQAIKPEDFGKITRPDELLEKQMQFALNNGIKAIEYMQKSLQIIEKTMHAFANENKVNIEK